MLMGIKFKANPTEQQKLVLSQWMGCARTIWNAKCDEDAYLRNFAKKYLPIKTYPEVDTKFSTYKNKELTPWLFKCPSQLLRNSATNWYKTYWKFIKGECGRPRRKKKTDEGSIYVTNELFSWKKNSGDSYQLFIGSKNNNIGFLSIKTHKKVKKPKSLYIRKKNGSYTVSFCYEDGLDEKTLKTESKHLKSLKKKSVKELERVTEGVDLGVKVMVQTTKGKYDYSDIAKQRLVSLEKKRKRYQRWMARQIKTSKRRKKTKSKISKTYIKQAEIRHDFCHKTSRKLVDQENISVLVFENLKTKNMTRKPKAKQDEHGRWLKNKAKAKAGLNKAILSKGWYKLVLFSTYKAKRENKVVFKVSPHYTSQECADCGHTQPENRVTRDHFVCQVCGHAENADLNAAKVVKKRAINLIKHSGTELSKTGVLTNPDIGHGDTGKSLEGKPTKARIKKPSNRKELSKKKELVVCV